MEFAIQLIIKLHACNAARISNNRCCQNWLLSRNEPSCLKSIYIYVLCQSCGLVYSF